MSNAASFRTLPRWFSLVGILAFALFVVACDTTPTGPDSRFPIVFQGENQIVDVALLSCSVSRDGMNQMEVTAELRGRFLETAGYAEFTFSADVVSEQSTGRQDNPMELTWSGTLYPVQPNGQLNATFLVEGADGTESLPVSLPIDRCRGF